MTDALALMRFLSSVRALKDAGLKRDERGGGDGGRDRFISFELCGKEIHCIKLPKQVCKFGLVCTWALKGPDTPPHLAARLSSLSSSVQARLIPKMPERFTPTPRHVTVKGPGVGGGGG